MEWALFLDFDGTLVDIAPTPDSVRVDPGLSSLMERLRAKLTGALAIVTGRDIGAVDHFLPGLALDVCGLHGLEQRVGGRIVRPDLPSLAPVVAALRDRFAAAPAVVVEDKDLSVALHWRLAPEREAECLGAAEAFLGELGPGYRLQYGKAMVELIPSGSDKGTGIRALQQHPPFQGRRGIFLGDDVTDEAGFRAVELGRGLSVKVGAGPTAAMFRLPSPEAVRSWLGEFARTGEPEAGLPPA